MFSCVHILSLFNFAQKSDGRQSKSNENLDHVCSLVVWDRYAPLKHAVFHLWTHNATIISGIHIFTLALADIFQTTSRPCFSAMFFVRLVRKLRNLCDSLPEFRAPH